MKDDKRFWVSFVYLAVGMILFIFSNGKWIVPVTAWIAPIFLLRFVRLQKPVPGLLCLFVVIVVASRIMLYGIIPPFLGTLSYLLTLYYALLGFLPYLVYRLFMNRTPGFILTLVFPAAAVSVEYVNNVLFGSWNSVAYSQFGNLPLMQLASITGIWGITFLVLWFGALVNWFWERQFQWLKIKRAALTYALVLGAVLLYGGLRIGAFPPDSQTVRIAAFTPWAALEKYDAERE